MFAYLDNSATTKPCPEAVAAMVEALETGWGNPSSLYRFGMDAARRLMAAREQVAKALGGQLGGGLLSGPNGQAGAACDHHGGRASRHSEPHEAPGGAGV